MPASGGSEAQPNYTPSLSHRARWRRSLLPSTLCWGLVFVAHVALGVGVPLQHEESPRAGTSTGPASLPAGCRESGVADSKIARLLDVIHDRPTSDAWDALGVLYAQRNSLNCALPAFESALRLQPDSAEARYNLALALIQSGQPARATQELDTLIRQKPQFAGAHYALGVVLQGKNQPEAAQREFETAIHDDLRFYAAYLDLAGLLASENKYPAAISLLEKAQSYKPPPEVAGQLQAALDKARAEGSHPPGDSPPVSKPPASQDAAAGSFNNRANQLLAEGKVQQAADAYREAVRLSPGNALFHYNYSLALDKLGDLDEEERELEAAIKLDMKFARAYTDLGMMEAKRGDYAAAESHLQTAIKLAPDDEVGYTALGMLQAKTGREPEAIQNFRQAVALVPNSPEAHINLGIALADQYDLAGGLAQFSEAIRLDPNSAKAHYNLGRFYFYTAKYLEARQQLDTACRLQPDYADALYSLALTERQLDNAPRATELLQKVVALSPGNADAQYLLGQNLLQAGKTEEAIAHWKLAVQADPNQSQSLYNLARTLDKLHDPAAEQYMQRFRELEQRNQLFDRVQALGNFALEAANAQNWPQAVEQMKEAIQLCGQCAQSAHLHRNLGLIYCRTGNRQEGEKELSTALEIDPHDVDARKALAVLANLAATPKN